MRLVPMRRIGRERRQSIDRLAARHYAGLHRLPGGPWPAGADGGHSSQSALVFTQMPRSPMREIVFALEFSGKAGGVAGSTTLRRARTSAPSQLWRVVLGGGAVDARVETVPGEAAVLESRVERFGDGTFVEDGTITYGSAGAVAFVTVGRGMVGPSAVAGQVHGAVVWTVTGGEGRLAGARGLITSNFTVGPEGDVVDDQIARLYLPE
jgi:hypothetical protein